MTTRKSDQVKLYRVTVAVTRLEDYEIEAPDPETAINDAFCESELVAIGETTRVEDCGVAEVSLG